MIRRMHRPHRGTCGAVASLLALGLMCDARLRADENEWLVPLGLPPQAAPKRISGGEGVPPLPLPATPIRRSERKREPKAPLLIGKIVWGESAEYRYAGGETRQIADWNLCPDDLAQLMRKAGRWFGLSYGSQAVSLNAFDGDPQTTPVLFLSGVRTMRPTDAQVKLLQEYLLRGGMVVFDSIAGSPYFLASARELAARLVPGEPLRPVPLDHPLFNMLADARTVAVPRRPEIVAPQFEGIYVGSRVACLVSPIGLGCGWDDHEVPLLDQAVYYDVDSACRLGVNLVAYAVGYAEAARSEARPELFGMRDERHPTDELVFAQLRHDGAWNVHPGAATALLRRLRAETSLGVSLKRVAVDPAREPLDAFPFLYMEGLDTFSWDERVRGALRQFLARGGTLLINNGLGLSTFDQAVRRELALLLPGSGLAPVPQDHPLLGACRPAGEVRFTPAAVKYNPPLEGPLLEAIALDGDLRVIYSPLDLACAWSGCDYPLARAYEGPGGVALGMNLLVYAMTH